MMSDNNQPSYYQGQDSNANPAWNDLLNSVPEDYHQALTPHLQNWDKGVNDKFNKIHEEYSAFKPFKEGGVSPQDIEFALGTVSHMNENPIEVYQRLGTWLQQQGMLEAETVPNTYGQEDTNQNLPD